MPATKSIPFNCTGDDYDIFANTTPEPKSNPIRISIAGETYEIEMLEQAYQALKDLHVGEDGIAVLGEKGRELLLRKNIQSGGSIQKAGQHIPLRMEWITAPDGKKINVPFDDLPFELDEKPQFIKVNGEYALNPKPTYKTIKEIRMFELLVMKFTQCPYKLKALLETKGAQLIEDTKSSKRVDSFWGNSDWIDEQGKTQPGRNALGSILMMLRDEIINEFSNFFKPSLYPVTSFSTEYCNRVGLPTPKKLFNEDIQITQILLDEISEHPEYIWFRSNGFKADDLPVGGYECLINKNHKKLDVDFIINKYIPNSHEDISKLTKNESAVGSKISQVLAIMLLKLELTNEKSMKLAIIEQATRRIARLEKAHFADPALKTSMKIAAFILASAIAVTVGAVAGSLIGFALGFAGGPLAGVSALLGMAAGAKTGLALTTTLLGASMIGAAGSVASHHRLFQPPHAIRVIRSAIAEAKQHALKPKI